MRLSKYIKSPKHGSRFREIITENATRGRYVKTSRIEAIERYLDDINFSRVNALAQEGMRGHKA